MRLSFGTTRIVLLTRRYAVKFPNVRRWRTFLYGLLANESEVAFSKMRWPELCPVRFGCSFFVVMDRAEPLTPKQWASFNALAFCQKEDYTVPAENKVDSFGWLENKIVAIDYGC
jgi:hypothetical protein